MVSRNVFCGASSPFLAGIRNGPADHLTGGPKTKRPPMKFEAFEVNNEIREKNSRIHLEQITKQMHKLQRS